MKVFLDDVRTPPDGSWFHAKSAPMALAALQHNHVDVLSLDHDLGTLTTGHDVLKVALQMGLQPSQVILHTQNPIGRFAMRDTLVGAGYRQTSPMTFRLADEGADVRKGSDERD